MKNIVGHVKNLKGKFVAEAKDGTLRVLQEGSPIYEGEAVYHLKDTGSDADINDQIIVGPEIQADAFLNLEMINGSEFALTDSSYQLFESSVLGEDFDFLQTDANTDANRDTSENDDGRPSGSDSDDDAPPESDSDQFSRSSTEPSQDPLSTGTGGSFEAGDDPGAVDDTPADSSEYNDQGEPSSEPESGLTDSEEDFVPINNPPAPYADTIVAEEEGGQYPLDITLSDPDGDPISVTITGLPTVGTITKANGTAIKAGDVLTQTEVSGLIFTAPEDVLSLIADSFEFSISDGTDTSPGKIKITVLPINDAPLVVSSTITVAEESTNTPLGLTAPTDVDGDDLTITVTGLPTMGNVTLADGTLVSDGQILTGAELAGLQYDAPAEYNLGDDAGDFTYSVSDGTVTVNGATDITVTPVNDAPVANNDFDSVTSSMMFLTLPMPHQ